MGTEVLNRNLNEILRDKNVDNCYKNNFKSSDNCFTVNNNENLNKNIIRRDFIKTDVNKNFASLIGELQNTLEKIDNRNKASEFNSFLKPSNYVAKKHNEFGKAEECKKPELKPELKPEVKPELKLEVKPEPKCKRMLWEKPPKTSREVSSPTKDIVAHKNKPENNDSESSENQEHKQELANLKSKKYPTEEEQNVIEDFIDSYLESIEVSFDPTNLHTSWPWNNTSHLPSTKNPSKTSYKETFVDSADELDVENFAQNLTEPNLLCYPDIFTGSPRIRHRVESHWSSFMTRWRALKSPSRHSVTPRPPDHEGLVGKDDSSSASLRPQTKDSFHSRSDETSHSSGNSRPSSPLKALRNRLGRSRRPRTLSLCEGDEEWAAPNKQWIDSRSVLEWARKCGNQDDEDSGVTGSDNDDAFVSSSASSKSSASGSSRDEAFSETCSNDAREDQAFICQTRNNTPPSQIPSSQQPQIVADHILTMHTSAPQPPNVVGRRYQKVSQQQHQQLISNETKDSLSEKPPVSQRTQSGRSRFSSCVDSLIWEEPQQLVDIPPSIPEYPKPPRSSSGRLLPSIPNAQSTPHKQPQNRRQTPPVTMTLGRGGLHAAHERRRQMPLTPNNNSNNFTTSPNRPNENRSVTTSPIRNYSVNNTQVAETSPVQQFQTTDLNTSASSHEEDAEKQPSFCTLPRHKKEVSFQIRTVTFEKGPGHRSLGFSIVGGTDTPRGSLGIFVKTVFAQGQAALSGSLQEGDEILAINAKPLHGCSHQEAIQAFKEIKTGKVVLHIGRRRRKGRTSQTVSNNTNN